MSEQERTRARTPSTGVRWRYLVPGASIGAVAVALVMVLSPTAAASVPGTVLSAPYHATVQPTLDENKNGCAKITSGKGIVFKRTTGIASGVASDVSSACPKATASPTGTYAYLDSGVTLGIPLKMSSTATSVAVSAAWKGAVSMAVADGFATGAAAPCSAPFETSLFLDVEYLWGYNSTTGRYSGENYTLDISSNTGPGLYEHYGTGPIPKPFHLNSTSYEFFDINRDKDRTCQSFSYLEAYADLTLIDKTSGVTYYPTYSTLNTMFGAELEVNNYTETSCYGYHEWSGPTNYSAKTNYTCSVYHQTTASLDDIFAPTPSSSTGTNNSLSLTLAVSGTGSAWFNHTFSPHHFYRLFIEFNVDDETEQSWAGAHATADYNFASAGGGFDLKSISIT